MPHDLGARAKQHNAKRDEAKLQHYNSTLDEVAAIIDSLIDEIYPETAPGKPNVKAYNPEDADALLALVRQLRRGGPSPRPEPGTKPRDTLNRREQATDDSSDDDTPATPAKSTAWQRFRGDTTDRA
jgi:hypothetical protein